MVNSGKNRNLTRSGFGKTIILLLEVLFVAGLNSSRAQNTWVQKADFAGTGRYAAVGFSIGSKGYIGTGYDSNDFTNDFWEYDPVADAWTQKADFGGTARYAAVGFSIGNKGYIGTGYSPGNLFKDFWEYDPVSNTWTQKADFGGTSRSGATGFSIGTKGYIVSGHDFNDFTNDSWEYDPATDTWTQKAGFGGTGRIAMAGFSIGNKGYAGTGYDGDDKNDFWEYDPASDAWAQKADFGGPARDGAVGFAISNKGYVGTGGNQYSGTKDFWEYDPSLDAWIQKADFGGTARTAAVGFYIGAKGYIGTGLDNGYNYKNDFWEYTPDCDGFTVYADADSDSYGDISNSYFAFDCVIPVGYVIDSSDCNDSSALVNPYAIEVCDGIDNNCNGNIDEGLLLIFYADADGDTYGNANDSTLACSLPNGYVTDNTDCDDSNAAVNPAATEICDGMDNNCDGNIDEGLLLTFYSDTDGDTYGDANNTTLACSPPNGYVTDSTDCNDGNAAVNPAATEICDGIDDNCDGNIDEGFPLVIFYADTDGDTYGDGSNFVLACSPPDGYVSDSSDCDDSNAFIHPGALEICNGFDDNCNGQTDEGVLSTFYADIDNDGFGNSNNVVTACSAPAGYVSDSTDCDDSNFLIHPGASEICNGIDDNCINGIDEGLVFVTYYQDADADSFGNPLVVDSACNGVPFGFVADSTDCDDNNPNVHPGAQEITNNGIDDNCNDVVDEFGVGMQDPDAVVNFTIYPNPAEDYTTIQFTLLHSSRVYIKVYDVNEKEIVTLLNGDVEQGEHSLLFNTNHFSKGIYTVKLIGDSGIENQKLIVQ